MMFTKFDMRMFEHAKNEAAKSDFDKFNVGCVITYKHNIIGSGHNSNKSHPMQKKYNRKYRNFNTTDGQYIHDSVHAEISALTSVPYTTGIDVDWSKVRIFIYRISKGNKFGYGNAKPCPACMQAIKNIGIRNVYYTDNDGYNYLKIDDSVKEGK